MENYQPVVTTYTLSYSGGNLTRMNIVETPYGGESERTFEYNEDEALPLPEINDPLGQIAYLYPLPGGYFGKTFKNQLIRVVKPFADNRGTEINSYTYDKDASGKTRSVIHDYKSMWKNDNEPERIDYQYTSIYNLRYSCD